MALDLAPLVAPIVASVPGWVIAVLSVFAALLVVVVVSAAALMVLGAVRGQKMIGGRMWDKDVYESAMRDLHERKRRGELLDRSANDALRDYQGMGRRRSGRI